MVLQIFIRDVNVESHSKIERFKAAFKAAEIENKNLFEADIIFHGTDENEKRVKTALTALTQTLKENKDPNQYIHVVNGPGGLASKDFFKKEEIDPEHQMLGTYDFSCEFDRETNEIKVTKTPRQLHKKATLLGGYILGTGCEDAVFEAVQYVTALLNAGKKPLVINLSGFSRGAVNAIRTANAISKLFAGEEIEINLFLVDPVPGYMQGMKPEDRTIPAMVKNCTVVLMDDERRPEFEAQDKVQLIIEDLNKTNIEYHLLRGNHSHAERFVNHPRNRKSPGIDAGRILWHYMQKFFKKTSPSFAKLKDVYVPYVLKEDETYTYIEDELKTTLSKQKLLEAYTLMALDDGYYSKLSPRKVAAAERKFVSRKRDYFIHGFDVFHDRTHMFLFKEMYPHYFDYFFQHNKAKATPIDVQNDIEKIIKNAEFTELNQFLKKNNHDLQKFRKNLPEPQGIPVIADNFYANKELMGLWDAVQLAVNPIIAGYDHSIKIEEAQNILDKIYENLGENHPEEKKIGFIKEALRAFTVTYAKNGLFPYRLAAIIGEKTEEDPMKVLLNYWTENFKNSEDPSVRRLLGILNTCTVEIKQIIELKVTAQIKKELIRVRMIKLAGEIKDLPKFNLKDNFLDYINTYAVNQKTNSIANKVIDSLNDYINQTSLFGINYVGQNEKIVAEVTMNLLKNVIKLNGANDLEAIKKILLIAEKVVHSFEKKARLSSLLNNFIKDISISTFDEPYEGKVKIESEIEKFNKFANRVLGAEEQIGKENENQKRFREITAQIKQYINNNQDYGPGYLIASHLSGMLTNMEVIGVESNRELIDYILGIAREGVQHIDDMPLRKLLGNRINKEMERAFDVGEDQEIVVDFIEKFKRNVDSIVESTSKVALIMLSLEKYCDNFEEYSDRYIILATSINKLLDTLKSYNLGNNVPAINLILENALAQLQSVEGGMKSDLTVLLEKLSIQLNENKKNVGEEKLSPKVKKEIEKFNIDMNLIFLSKRELERPEIQREKKPILIVRKPELNEAKKPLFTTGQWIAFGILAGVALAGIAALIFFTGGFAAIPMGIGAGAAGLVGVSGLSTAAAIGIGMGLITVASAAVGGFFAGVTKKICDCFSSRKKKPVVPPVLISPEVILEKPREDKRESHREIEGRPNLMENEKEEEEQVLSTKKKDGPKKQTTAKLLGQMPVEEGVKEGKKEVERVKSEVEVQQPEVKKVERKEEEKKELGTAPPPIEKTNSFGLNPSE